MHPFKLVAALPILLMSLLVAVLIMEHYSVRHSRQMCFVIGTISSFAVTLILTLIFFTP